MQEHEDLTSWFSGREKRGCQTSSFVASLCLCGTKGRHVRCFQVEALWDVADRMYLYKHIQAQGVRQRFGALDFQWVLGNTGVESDSCTLKTNKCLQQVLYKCCRNGFLRN